MKWNASGNYGQSLVWGTPQDGFITGYVSYYSNGKTNKVIIGTVTCDLFPKVERNDFVTMQGARDWCEKWVGFAVELLEARKTIALRERQSQQDLQTIMALREELHDYKYPHATDSKVRFDR